MNTETSNIRNVRSDKISFQAAMKTSWTLFHSLCQIRHTVFQSTWNKEFFPKHWTFLQTGNSLTNQPSRNKVKWWIQPGFLAVTFKFPPKTIKKIRKKSYLNLSKLRNSGSKVKLLSYGDVSFLCCAGVLQISPSFCNTQFVLRRKRNFDLQSWILSISSGAVL